MAPKQRLKRYPKHPEAPALPAPPSVAPPPAAKAKAKAAARNPPALPPPPPPAALPQPAAKAKAKATAKAAAAKPKPVARQRSSPRLRERREEVLLDSPPKSPGSPPAAAPAAAEVPMANRGANSSSQGQEGGVENKPLEALSSRQLALALEQSESKELRGLATIVEKHELSGKVLSELMDRHSREDLRTLLDISMGKGFELELFVEHARDQGVDGSLLVPRRGRKRTRDDDDRSDDGAVSDREGAANKDSRSLEGMTSEELVKALGQSDRKALVELTDIIKEHELDGDTLSDYVWQLSEEQLMRKLDLLMGKCHQLRKFVKQARKHGVRMAGPADRRGGRK